MHRNVFEMFLEPSADFKIPMILCARTPTPGSHISSSLDSAYLAPHLPPACLWYVSL